MRTLSVLASLMLISAACTTPAAPAVAITTSTPPPTITPAPSVIPSPTVSLPVSKGTALPVSNEPITPKNLDRLKLLAQWPTDGWWIDALAISPDGALLAIYDGQDPKAAIVRLDTGAKAWSIDHATNFAAGRPLSFSPDGSLIQILCGIYQTGDGTLVRQFSTSEYLKDSCNNLTFLPDGTKVAVSMLQKPYELNFWAVDGSQLLQTFPLYVQPETIAGQQYTFSPDGSLLLAHEWVSNWAKNLWLFQSTDGEFIKKFEYGPYDRLGIWDLHWAFSPDRKLLAIDITRADMYAKLLHLDEMPHTLEIWRLSDMTRIQQLDGPGELCGLAFSAAADLLAERAYGRVTLRSIADWSMIGEIEVPGCAPILFSPDGTRLISGSQSDIAAPSIRVYGVMP
jgi:WD40 repeat protein